MSILDVAENSTRAEASLVRIEIDINTVSDRMKLIIADDGCGMTQEQVTAKLQLGGCDITRSALAKIEVGQRHVYPDEIKLLKEILSISYDDLFDSN